MNDGNNEQQKRKQFTRFLKRYTRQARGGFLYSDAIRRHELLGQRWLQVDFDDLRVYDREHVDHLASDIISEPTSTLRVVCTCFCCCCSFSFHLKGLVVS